MPFAEGSLYVASMPQTFDPRLDVLPAAQRRLWDELGDTPPEFVLYGGTALALRLGHRKSADFDFFGAKPFDPGELLERNGAKARPCEALIFWRATVTPGRKR